MSQSSFLFANITNKTAKVTSRSAFALYLPIYTKFMTPYVTDIKTLLALQQDVRTYAGNLINGVSLQVNVGDRLAKKFFFSALLHCSEKNLRKSISCRMGTLGKVV